MLETSDRVDQFKADVAQMKLRSAGASQRERVLLVVSVVMMLAGIGLAIGAYSAALNVKVTPASNLDVLNSNAYMPLAISGLTISVVGGFLFLRYSLAQFLRYWLLRQSYEQRVAIDEASRRPPTVRPSVTTTGPAAAFGKVVPMTAAEDDAKLQARRKDPRYQRLMLATREAARGGYDAVSMRELAEVTRMSLTSVYQFCSSKDHLIAEAHLEGMEDFRRMLVGGQRRGGTVESRVLRVVRGIVNGLERDEVLTRTLMRAIYSLDAGTSDVSRSLGMTTREMLINAIADDDVGDRDAVIEILGRVIDSAVYGWLARGETVEDVRAVLEQAVHLLVGAGDTKPAVRPTRRRPTKASPNAQARPAKSS